MARRPEGYWRGGTSRAGPEWLARQRTRLFFNPLKEAAVLLILAIVLLIIAIAGGAIIHPILFALAIVALVLFFTGR